LEKRTYKKQIIWNVTNLRNRREAEKTVIPLRSSINAEVGTPKSVGFRNMRLRLPEVFAIEMERKMRFSDHGSLQLILT
jgi:hypothetical protein